ncbi:MAG: hypothetical protein AB4426_31555 [Xenococcaceae cyanobacterium]
MIDISRDEVRLAGLLKRLAGRWCFANADAVPDDRPSPVDISATNEALVLGGRPLEDFVGVSPNDRRVLPLEELPHRAIASEQIAVGLLCGGLGTRSGGKVHPLLVVEEPDAQPPRTLLDLKLEQLANSPLAGAKLLVLGSPLNETALRQHLEGLPVTQRPRLFTGGLVPRLAPYQVPSAPPILYRDESGHLSYNPAGHLDALRWLVVTGALADLHDVEVLMIASYSNWGRLFTNQALSGAAYAAEQGRQEPGILFVVEVTARPKDKRTGSMLVTRTDDPDELRLVKYGYGGGVPTLTEGDTVLMSTNTLYFSLENLLRRLTRACPEVGLPESREALDKLLQDAREGRRRTEACQLFDTAFPVEPLLTLKRTAEGAAVLQAERHLDQLSLLPGSSIIKAVKVGAERAVSIKLTADLQDPLKQAYLFGNR